MAVHPKDLNASNPRLQCSVCKKWMRSTGLVAREDGVLVEISRFTSCNYGNGDHLSGDGMEVCEQCCLLKCHAIYQSNRNSHDE